MRFITMVFLLGAFVFMMTGCAPNPQEEFSTFLTAHVSTIEPMLKDMNLAYWNATGTGKEEYYTQYSDLLLKIRTLYSNHEEYEKLKAWEASGKVTDPLLKRQLVLLKNAYAENQIDPALLEKMVKLSTDIEKKFNTFRATFEGAAVDDNALRTVLAEETKSARRQEAWEAFKKVGEEVAPDLIQLVKMRNEAAKALGYDDYYVMQLDLREQSVEELFKVFDELKTLTDEPFRQVKAQIDETLAKKYRIKPDAMMPWHYQDFFFQEAPDLGGVDIDAVLKDKDIVQIVSTFYDGIGLPVKGILENSDLYGRDGKYQHAYCMDVDRKGDVRTMDSITPSHYWLSTLMHELGHGVYSKNIDPNLPFLLREEAHIFTTEAIAEMFERMTNNADWLKVMLDLDDATTDAWRDKLHMQERMGQLVFCRWTEVMLRFERELYRDPDQDLNALWWNLKSEYQFLTPPEGRNAPDWASKIHLTSSPVYYHNYMLGQLLASQLLHTMATDILKEGTASDVIFIGHPELGAFLKEKVFAPGKTKRWDEFVVDATGEPLTAKYFAEQFVN
ncbi:MAG TPA: M2 family metallopeptidase [Thermoanaerobaculia bacterium]|nr:M2 family metallopeptidase [Thermoanaerobaculia bacterium]HUM29314.1 M2 family metallopeptidase [Thermoanaerobaculia bacterium]HXK67728.1 M2 family metallopeptidase [Thermoanaerobaculia bacterium]